MVSAMMQAQLVEIQLDATADLLLFLVRSAEVMH